MYCFHVLAQTHIGAATLYTCALAGVGFKAAAFKSVSAFNESSINGEEVERRTRDGLLKPAKGSTDSSVNSVVAGKGVNSSGSTPIVDCAAKSRDGSGAVADEGDVGGTNTNIFNIVRKATSITQFSSADAILEEADKLMNPSGSNDGSTGNLMGGVAIPAAPGASNDESTGPVKFAPRASKSITLHRQPDGTFNANA